MYMCCIFSLDNMSRISATVPDDLMDHIYSRCDEDDIAQAEVIRRSLRHYFSDEDMIQEKDKMIDRLEEQLKDKQELIDRLKLEVKDCNTELKEERDKPGFGDWLQEQNALARGFIGLGLQFAGMSFPSRIDDDLDQGQEGD